MLNEFRVQTITWDKANSKIYETIKASEGDSNGRKLRVQILDNGEAVNLSGSSLSLAWKSTTNKGLDKFDLVDANKGIFEIFYTTEMLSTSGKITASLVLVDSVGRLESDPFGISISRSIVDDDSVQSDNSFTALTEALVRVTDLEGNYAPRLNEVTAQLAQTDDRVSGLILEYDISPEKDPEIIDARSGSDTLGQYVRGIDKKNRVPYFNKVKNGSFDSERENWEYNSPITYDSNKALFGHQSAILDHRDGIYVRLHQTIPTTKGHKYYLSAWGVTEIHSDRDETNTFGYTHGRRFDNLPNPLGRFYSDGWNKVTGVVEAEDEQIILGVVNQTNHSGKLWVDGFMCLDLTVLFGRGNEPTVEEMNELEHYMPLDFFDDSVPSGKMVLQTFRSVYGLSKVFTEENENWEGE